MTAGSGLRAFTLVELLVVVSILSLLISLLAPTLSRARVLTRNTMCHSNNRAIRVGDWKLIATGQEGPWELYDLGKDRCEQQDLAAANPDRVRRLAALWKEHDDEYVRRRESWAPTTKRRMQTPG